MIKHVLVIVLLWSAGSAVAAPDAAQLRKTCADAMNADPTFAQSIIAKVVDNDTIVKAHEDAAYHVAKNERHVILAYGAMWAIAAGFVIFLWRRQQLLRAELAQLRRDLDAAAKEPA